MNKFITLYDQFYFQRLEKLYAKIEYLEKKQEFEPSPRVKSQLEKKKADYSALQSQYNSFLQKNGLDFSSKLPDDVILRLDTISMRFGGLKAVDNLTIDVKQGEIFGLIGPNGAGKTTVFNCITQFYKIKSGEMYFRAKQGRVVRLTDYAVHDVVRLGIVRTFQNLELIPELTIIDNLLIGAHTQYITTYFDHMLNLKRVQNEEKILHAKAEKVLEYLHLTAIKDAYPIGLPYGVLKRIELARTLMANANLIILDEPAAGLNDKETEELTEIIRTIAKEFKVTIFLVEHDMGLVMDLCDHICAISFGKKLAYGTPAEIQNDKSVQEAYLGSEVDA